MRVRNSGSRAALWGLLALCLALGACQTLVKLKNEFDPRERPAEKEYRQAIAPYLANGVIYHGPATELSIHALALSRKVRLAMARRRAQALSLTAGQAEKLRRDALAAGKGVIEIAASVFVPEQKWNDLGGPQPVWNIFIQNRRGQRLYPLDRRRIKRRTPLAEALYPFWGQWDRLFRLKFPDHLPSGRPFLTPGEDHFRLVVSGAPGRTELLLRWD